MTTFTTAWRGVLIDDRQARGEFLAPAHGPVEYGRSGDDECERRCRCAAVSAEPMPEHVVLILSGGLDSTVLGYRLRAGGSRLTMLSFDYGQRHRRELEYACRTAVKLTGAHRVVDLSPISGLLAGSSLTDAAVDVPDGHYSDLSMRATVVPNRNAIMLDVAVARAVAVQAGAVTFGAHAGDHPIYPDCRLVFLNAYRRMVLLANEGFLAPNFTVLAPFIGLSKADIVTIGADLGVPFADLDPATVQRRAH